MEVVSTIDLVDALTARSLCCDCLALATGLSPLDVRNSLLRAARDVRFNTWTPCGSCGAVDQTYGIMR